MVDNKIKTEEIKFLIQKINQTQENTIRKNDPHLSKKIDRVLDTTKNLPENKLKEVLTPEFFKIVKEIEEKFGPIIKDSQSPLKKIIYNQAKITEEQAADQKRKQEVNQKTHIFQSPGDGQQKTTQTQDKKNENSAQNQPGKIQQYEKERVALGPIAMALKVASDSVVNASKDATQKMKKTFENTKANITKKEDLTLEKLHTTADAAKEAMKQFMQNPASKVQQKMEKEAETHPEGIAGIIREMTREGSQANLYKEMNKVKRNNPEAWKQVTNAVKNYSAARRDAMDTLKNAGPFYQKEMTKLDASIGELAKNIPGEEGKNLMEDLGEKIKQVVEKAIELVNQVIKPQVNVNSKTSASPSPSL